MLFCADRSKGICFCRRIFSVLVLLLRNMFPCLSFHHELFKIKFVLNFSLTLVLIVLCNKKSDTKRNKSACGLNSQFFPCLSLKKRISVQFRFVNLTQNCVFNTCLKTDIRFSHTAFFQLFALTPFAFFVASYFSFLLL